MTRAQSMGAQSMFTSFISFEIHSKMQSVLIFSIEGTVSSHCDVEVFLCPGPISGCSAPRFFFQSSPRAFLGQSTSRENGVWRLEFKRPLTFHPQSVHCMGVQATMHSGISAYPAGDDKVSDEDGCLLVLPGES